MSVLIKYENCDMLTMTVALFRRNPFATEGPSGNPHAASILIVAHREVRGYSALKLLLIVRRKRRLHRNRGFWHSTGHTGTSGSRS